MKYKNFILILCFSLCLNNFLLNSKTTALVPIDNKIIEKKNPAYQSTMKEIIKAEEQKEKPLTILSSTIIAFMIMQMMIDPDGTKIKTAAEFNKKYLQWLEKSGNTSFKIYDETKALSAPERKKLIEGPTGKSVVVEIKEEKTIEDID